MFFDKVLTGTAVLCYNDTFAIELIEKLRQNGNRVPEDISVIGIDDCMLASIYSLTSIIHPKEQIGEAAVRLLLSMINGSPGRNIMFKPVLMQRGSVRRLD